MSNSHLVNKPLPIILHGIFNKIQIKLIDFPGYKIYSNINTLICKRITKQLLAYPPNTCKMESFIHDFIIMRQWDYTDQQILFMCINISEESINLIKLVYPPNNKYNYIQLSENQALLEYPNYFEEMQASPTISPLPSPKPIKLHDYNISVILEDPITNQGILFLSGSTGAENLNQLLELGITHIINISDLIPNYFENELSESGNKLFEYMNIKIPDCSSIDITTYFDNTFQFINSAIQNKGKVLIHCFAGKSRSASIVIGYIMKTKSLSFLEALKFVQSQREIVEPNFGFCSQLMQYEKNMKNK
jgi:protein-tyrosine phosphatase